MVWALYTESPQWALTGLAIRTRGGLPAAAFGGRKEIMSHLSPEGPVYQAGTLSGNPIAMQAGLTTLEHLERKDFYKELNKKSMKLMTEIKAIAKKKSPSF